MSETSEHYCLTCKANFVREELLEEAEDGCDIYGGDKVICPWYFSIRDSRLKEKAFNRTLFLFLSLSSIYFISID